MGKYIPIDQAFAEIDEARESPADTKHGVIMAAVEREDLRRRKVSEEKCRVGGCDEERVPHRLVCSKHYNEQQREARKKRVSGKARPTPEHHKPPPERVALPGNIGSAQLEIHGVLDLPEFARLFTRLPAGVTQAVLAAAVWGYLYGKGLVKGGG